eukprot:CAMPEP_0197394806 /NCGR_PEP_ID=MMETSP1165-20131217/6147_1 /TAXON_ID=284809 /ORGANISM="Chrysocystis fragilis, Strain CCMP3189" /LENGTH=240 /DNA_ID=CAMNT_0042920543 /DNA_START=75 /DNA_END=793 /DNA_ORIENTATION=+
MRRSSHCSKCGSWGKAGLKPGISRASRGTWGGSARVLSGPGARAHRTERREWPQQLEEGQCLVRDSRSGRASRREARSVDGGGRHPNIRVVVDTLTDFPALDALHDPRFLIEARQIIGVRAHVFFGLQVGENRHARLTFILLGRVALVVGRSDPGEAQQHRAGRNAPDRPPRKPARRVLGLPNDLGIPAGRRHVLDRGLEVVVGDVPPFARSHPPDRGGQRPPRRARGRDSYHRRVRVPR